MTSSRPPARIAYLILAHRAPRQVVRLVRRLASPEASFFVHVDRYSPASVYDAIRDGLASLPQAHLVRRHGCAWAGFGIVRGALEALAAAAETDGEFDVAVLLSGQDYPVRPVGEIHEWLGARRGSSFVNHFSVPTDNWLDGGLRRFTHWHWRGRVLGRYVMFPHPRLPFLHTWERGFLPGLAPYGGSMYWGLSAEAAAYVLDVVRTRRDVVRFFRHVDVPDESFFQTILLNSPLADTVVDDDLHYTDWNVTDSHPKTLGEGDLDVVLASGELFARKFEDGSVLDAIDARVHGG